MALTILTAASGKGFVPGVALTGLRVLVVEDEFLVALDLADLLDGWGCRPGVPTAA